MSVNCPVCHGHELQICQACNGTGVQPASATKFRPAVCSACFGCGELPCKECQQAPERTDVSTPAGRWLAIYRS